MHIVSAFADSTADFNCVAFLFSSQIVHLPEAAKSFKAAIPRSDREESLFLDVHRERKIPEPENDGFFSSL